MNIISGPIIGHLKHICDASCFWGEDVFWTKYLTEGKLILRSSFVTDSFWESVHAFFRLLIFFIKINFFEKIFPE